MNVEQILSGIVYILFVYLLKSLYEWFLFVHNFSMIVNFQDLFLVEMYRKIKINFYPFDES
jgi:hypothetical protein